MFRALSKHRIGGSGAGHGFRGRGAACLLLVMALALLAVGLIWWVAAQPAEAQDRRTFVTNFGQNRNGTFKAERGEQGYGQKFTTGSTRGGYLLDRVVLRVEKGVESRYINLEGALYTVPSDGSRGSKLFTFAHPGDLHNRNTSNYRFTAPDNWMLLPNTSQENQGQLYESIRDLFAGAQALGLTAGPMTTLRPWTTDTDGWNAGNAGSSPIRTAWTIWTPGQWPQLKAAVRVVGHRQIAEGGASQPRYYISSLAGSAEQLLAAIRSHWSIENSLHWTLDVTFREDQRRVRKDHGPQNINTPRQIGHNLLQNETTLKVGIQGKRLNAGWDEGYLFKVLLG